MRRRALALLAVCTLLLLGVSTPANAAATGFTAVNSASFEAGPQASGGFVTIFTNGPVTDENRTFDFKWPETTPGGLYVQTNNCQREGDNRKLPILYVGPSGAGTQINLYVMNVDDFADETYPPCDAWASARWTVHPKAGFGGDITATVEVVPSRPGIFMNGSAPAGVHYNATTGANTDFATCNATPSRCPVATGGRANYLLVYTTGAEIWGCPTEDFSCTDDERISFYLTPASGGSSVEQPLDFFGFAGFFGQEQANIRIKAGTPAGEYRLKVTTPYPDNSAQQVRLLLGAAN